MTLLIVSLAYASASLLVAFFATEEAFDHDNRLCAIVALTCWLWPLWLLWAVGTVVVELLKVAVGK